MNSDKQLLFAVDCSRHAKQPHFEHADGGRPRDRSRRLFCSVFFCLVFISGFLCFQRVVPIAKQHAAHLLLIFSSRREQCEVRENRQSVEKGSAKDAMLSGRHRVNTSWTTLNDGRPRNSSTSAGGLRRSRCAVVCRKRRLRTPCGDLRGEKIPQPLSRSPGSNKADLNERRGLGKRFDRVAQPPAEPVLGVLSGSVYSLITKVNQWGQRR